MTDPNPFEPPQIPMTPQDAGLHLAGLARAECEKPREERNWERFAELAAYMIQTAFDAGAANGSVEFERGTIEGVRFIVEARTFRCDCGAEAVVDAADVDTAVHEVQCPRCGKAMTEVMEP